MKPIEQCHVCILDYGTFIGLADAFAKKASRVSYYSPFEQEFLDMKRCVIGDNFQAFGRQDEYMDPEFFNSVDLWVFPDLGFKGLQKYLRSLGKTVLGSMGASDLELFRTLFIRTIERLGLPMVETVPIRGVTALSAHLKPLKNKWVKLNRYRDNMETFHWQDWDHGQRNLEKLAWDFGPMKEYAVFVVQDPIDGTDESPVIEVGYDGFCVDGRFPSKSFQGVELKNKLYLGSALDYDHLPDPVREVNEVFGEELKRFGYRNMLATEIRIKDGVGHFTDPTCRMAGQTMEHLLTTCTNLPEFLLEAARGELIVPEFQNDFAAEATLHYTGETEGWKTLRVSDEAYPWVKLYHCCRDEDGLYQFPPRKSDEVGVLVANGETPEAAIENLKSNFSLLGDEPVRIDLEGFAQLIDEIKEAEDNGVPFSDKPMPDPAIAIS